MEAQPLEMGRLGLQNDQLEATCFGWPHLGAQGRSNGSECKQMPQVRAAEPTSPHEEGICHFGGGETACQKDGGVWGRENNGLGRPCRDQKTRPLQSPAVKLEGAAGTPRLGAEEHQLATEGVCSSLCSGTSPTLNSYQLMEGPNKCWAQRGTWQTTGSSSKSLLGVGQAGLKRKGQPDWGRGAR